MYTLPKNLISVAILPLLLKTLVLGMVWLWYRYAITHCYLRRFVTCLAHAFANAACCCRDPWCCLSLPNQTPAQCFLFAGLVLVLDPSASHPHRRDKVILNNAHAPLPHHGAVNKKYHNFPPPSRKTAILFQPFAL